ncbi:MAG TPA: hypothetical protein VHL08_02310 [Dongiaceae bacterium]|jgi:hypothetical protein|nr:hypothetical protein [Dongiaceae bacterium]
MNENEKDRRRRQRSWALFAALIGFVLLMYAITIVRVKGGG